MQKIKVEIWSDIACPYCYIGKRKFEKALEFFPHRESVEIVWHSYELSPKLTKGTTNGTWLEHIAKITEGDEKSALDVAEDLKEKAREVGLEYNLEKVVLTNTSDALRLVALSEEKGLGGDTEEALFKAYFTDGKDVSDRNLLIEIGASVGLDKEIVAQMLDSDRFVKDLKADKNYSENVLHLNFIPYYLINDKIKIEGSLEVEQYVQALQVVNDDNSEITNFSGHSCTLDGVCS